MIPSKETSIRVLAIWSVAMAFGGLAVGVIAEDEDHLRAYGTPTIFPDLTPRPIEVPSRSKSQLPPRKIPTEYHLEKQVNGHKIQVHIEQKPFDRQQHQVEVRNHVTYVDGKVAIGTDGTVTMQREFSRFEVSWDGHKLKIPKSIYADLFDADLTSRESSDADGGTYTNVNSDGTAILIELWGSDGAGTYKSWLIIKSDGSCVRFVDNGIC